MERSSLIGDVGGLFHPLVILHLLSISRGRAFTFVFAVEDVELDPLRCSSFFVDFSESLLFSPGTTHVHITTLFSRKLVTTPTRYGRASWWFASHPVTRARRTSSSLSRRCCGSSILIPLARSSCLARLVLSLSRATLEPPSGSFSSPRSILSRQRSVWFAVHPSPVRMARQPMQWAPGEAHSPGDDWQFYVGWVRAAVASCHRTRLLPSPARSPAGDKRVPLMFCANSPSHLSLSSTLSCRTVLHLLSPEGVPTYAWPSSDLHFFFGRTGMRDQVSRQVQLR